MSFQIHLRISAPLFAVVVFTLLSCTSVQNTGEVLQQDIGSDTSKYVEIINKINGSIPPSYTASVGLNSILQKQRITSSGTIYFLSNPFSIRIKFTDLIFQSVLADILLVNNSLTAYFPSENTAYKNSDFSSADSSPFMINPSIVSSVALSRIPIISDSKPTNVYKAEDPAVSVIVFESKTQLESVYFRNDIPEKILIAPKNGGGKTEIKYTGLFYSDGSAFFKKISARNEATGDFLQIEYRKVRTDIPIDPKKIFTLSIPFGVKFVQ